MVWVISWSIRTKSALAKAIAEFDSLLGCIRRTKVESNRLDVLSEAVREYERKNLPVTERTPAERLRFLLDVHDLDTLRLAALTGIHAAFLDGVLSQSVDLSEEDANRLADHFALDRAAFRTRQAIRQPPA